MCVIRRETHKSPGVMLCFAMNGFWMATISSRPMLGWNAVSMSANVMIEPSAPPPLCVQVSKADPSILPRKYRTRTGPGPRGRARWRSSRGRHYQKFSASSRRDHLNDLQTNRFMGLSAALAALEEVLLDVVEDVEPGAARCVADSGAVRAGCAFLLDYGSCASWTTFSKLFRSGLAPGTLTLCH